MFSNGRPSGRAVPKICSSKNIFLELFCFCNKFEYYNFIACVVIASAQSLEPSFHFLSPQIDLGGCPTGMYRRAHIHLSVATYIAYSYTCTQCFCGQMRWIKKIMSVTKSMKAFLTQETWTSKYIFYEHQNSL